MWIYLISSGVIDAPTDPAVWGAQHIKFPKENTLGRMWPSSFHLATLQVLRLSLRKAFAMELIYECIIVKYLIICHYFGLKNKTKLVSLTFFLTKHFYYPFMSQAVVVGRDKGEFKGYYRCPRGSGPPLAIDIYPFHYTSHVTDNYPVTLEYI